jgi:hypothetical protein
MAGRGCVIQGSLTSFSSLSFFLSFSLSLSLSLSLFLSFSLSLSFPIVQVTKVNGDVTQEETHSLPVALHR